MTPDAAQRLLSETRPVWLQPLGIHVENTSREEITLRLPITPEITDTDGRVIASALATLAETAMALLCRLHLDQAEWPHPRNLEIQWLRETMGDDLHATAQVAKALPGKLEINCALVAQPSGKATALAEASYPR